MSIARKEGRSVVFHREQLLLFAREEYDDKRWERDCTRKVGREATEIHASRWNLGEKIY